MVKSDYPTPRVRDKSSWYLALKPHWALRPQIYPAMSGHNAICVATALLETGMVPMQEPRTEFQLEAPAGLIDIVAECRHGKVRAGLGRG